MTLLKSILGLGLTLLLTSMTVSSNELGLTESQLQSLLTLAPVTASEATVAKVKLQTGKEKTKASATINKPPKIGKSIFSCKKKYCKYMSSCAEARYKFEQCGHHSLDRDKDGIPCENVCL